MFGRSLFGGIFVVFRNGCDGCADTNHVFHGKSKSNAAALRLDADGLVQRTKYVVLDLLVDDDPYDIILRLDDKAEHSYGKRISFTQFMNDRAARCACLTRARHYLFVTTCVDNTEYHLILTHNLLRNNAVFRNDL